VYILELSDPAGVHKVEFQLTPRHLERKAVDVVFDVFGADPEYLTSNQLIAPEAADDVRKIQSALFDEDDQGRFIRDNVRLTAEGKDLDPDRPLRDAFPKSGEGFGTCHARVEYLDGERPETTDAKVLQFAKMLLLHQIAEGAPLDVTVEHPELQPLVEWAEKNQLIEIDVKKAAYKLTAKGKNMHDEQLAEAQELIKRYDIFGDVDVDASGAVHFDTGLGRDLRVPIFELEGVDPFRARFVIGLNDGEWKDTNWIENALKESWYSEVFAPVERAPSLEDIGEEQLRSIIDQGKKKLRSENYAGGHNGHGPHGSSWN
jgi:hypothetical protein